MTRRAAVVTGAGRGIGRAIALDLAQAGYGVGLQSRTEADLEAVRAEIEGRGGQAIAVSGDVTQPEAAKALIERSAELGTLHVAVAGAGQAFSAPVSKTTPDDLQALFQVNTVAPFHLLQAASETMLAAKTRGRIIVVASTASIKGMRYTGAYSASKHAILGLVRCAALEVARSGITVNAVCPGWVETDMFDQTLANIVAKTGRTTEDARNQLERAIPVGEVLAPEHVAAMVRYLVSDAAAQLTGQALVIDGGASL